MTTNDLFTERLIGLGREYDKMLAQASIERCNCMVRYGDGSQMPAVKLGKKMEFTNSEGRPITKPDSYEMMHHNQIARLMRERNEVYIGHMIGPVRSRPI